MVLLGALGALGAPVRTLSGTIRSSESVPWGHLQVHSAVPTSEACSELPKSDLFQVETDLPEAGAKRQNRLLSILQNRARV